MHEDGSRKWLAPRSSDGRFYKRRRMLAWGLITLFAGLPYIQVGGKPIILLDLAAREFTFLGTTLLATDTLLLMLFMMTVFVSVFLLTALFGRVWCGWGCPQTVYMEFLFRPLERLVLGRDYRKSDSSHFSARRLVMYVLYLLVALALAHTFLSYFVGVDTLSVWMRRSPFEHPASFSVMAVTTLLIMIDFVYFREQMCTLACPYGRFQSALLDKQSLIIGYDVARGEPRGKPSDQTGDCIDCKACVVTCPTGIDIRKGLQMECVACTQCIDACDAIMDRLGKPRGLVKYTSEDQLASKPTSVWRTRPVIYTVLLIGLLASLTAAAAFRKDADITILRDKQSPYSVLPNDEVTNTLRVKIVNRTDSVKTYTVSLPMIEAARLASGNNPLEIASGATGTVQLLIILPRATFSDGRVKAQFHISDGDDFEEDVPYNLLGP